MAPFCCAAGPDALSRPGIRRLPGSSESEAVFAETVTTETAGSRRGEDGDPRGGGGGGRGGGAWVTLPRQ